jgi:3-deoxy-manno-octulosonate cytidylyltransferase (CMP-KDO synthetase)
MYKNKKIVCVIPARLASHRFPEKMLVTLQGRPLLSWVWDAAKKVTLFDDVIFAVDDQRLVDCVATFGGKAVLTSVSCLVGTDRLVELILNQKIDADIVVNWQGDEPFIHEAMINDLLQSIDASGQDAWTLKTRIKNSADIAARNIAKVITAQNGQALCFSRSAIPCVRDSQSVDMAMAEIPFYKHVGLYAFTPHALRRIAGMGKSALEQAEKLEMLRWLDFGLPVVVHETAYEVFGIDTPADLARAEKFLLENSNNRQTV